MPYTPPPSTRGGEADEDILSINQDEVASAAAPATHPQVLDDVFTPPPFLLARDVRREVNGLAPYAPAPAAAPETADRFSAETEVSTVAELAGAPRLEPEAARNPSRPQAASAELFGRRPPIVPAAVNQAVDAAARTAHETARPGSPEEAVEVAREASRPETPAVTPRPAAQPDNYAVGLRLLRISPALLVVSSVGFFLLIFLLSWLYQPAAQPETIAAAAVQNHSANRQAVVPAPPAAETAVAPARNPEPAQPAPQPAPAAAKPAAAEKPVPAEKPVAAEKAAAEKAAAAPQPAAPAGRFAVQVGSFNSPSEANERVSKLRSSGFAARAAAVDIPQRGTWHRVYVGGFATREEAARHASELRAKGVAPSGLVVEVK
ncbi:MAG TPA: SPOR domain-containing protein [Pyrinomonadaceae bacterium]|nr:SPOR domain-containing protein [Pyrinomonadaceae bacterium]